MNWTMKDPAFSMQLFRFIDVFPMLRTPEQVHEYLIDYLSQPGVTLPPGLDLGLKAGGLAKGLVAKTIAGRITAMAGNFIAGADAAAALPVLREALEARRGLQRRSAGRGLRQRGRGRGLPAPLPRPARGPAGGRRPLAGRAASGERSPRPRAADERLDQDQFALSPRTDPIDFEGSLRTLAAALRPILRKAAERGVMVNFDMEQAAFKDLTLALFERCCEAIDFPAGLAMQAYLRSGTDDAGRLIDWARRSGRQVTVRLIKGAYWDYEVIHAERMGWPVPVWTDKRATDACFERMAAMFVGGHAAAGGRGRRQAGHRLAQRPLDRPYAGPAGEARPARRRPSKSRSSTAWPIRSGAALVAARAAGPRVRAGGRDDPRHGLPRPPAAGEHVEPIVAAGRLLGRSARRGAAGLAARSTNPSADQARRARTVAQAGSA